MSPYFTDTDQTTVNSPVRHSPSLRNSTSPRATPQASPAMPIITRRHSHSPRVRPDTSMVDATTPLDSVRETRRSSSRLSSAGGNAMSPPVLTPVQLQQSNGPLMVNGIGSTSESTYSSPEFKRRVSLKFFTNYILLTQSLGVQVNPHFMTIAMSRSFRNCVM